MFRTKVPVDRAGNGGGDSVLGDQTPGYAADMADPKEARNDTDETRSDEDGELANPGPVPPEPEDASDTGERPGDLAPQAGGPAHED